MNRAIFFKFAVLALLPRIEVAAVSVTNPQLSGPISGGGHGVAFGAVPADDLTRAGYSQSEYSTAALPPLMETWAHGGLMPVSGPPSQLRLPITKSGCW